MNGWFRIAWVLVIVVSAIDGHLFFRNRDVIHQFEKNPLGILLLEMNDGSVWLFLLLKFLGTILVSALLLVIYCQRPSLGFIIALCLSIFQLALLYYLCSF